MAVHWTENDPIAGSVDRLRRLQRARGPQAAPNVMRPPPAGLVMADGEGKPVPQGGAPTHATRQQMIEDRIAAGLSPEQAARLTDSELRVAGPLPMALFRQRQRPDEMQARRDRITKGKRDDERMEGFRLNYNAATGAPGAGYDSQGNAIEDPAPAAKQTDFGRTREHPVLAAHLARGEETQARFDEQIAARNKGDELAKQAGYKDQYHRQQASIERNGQANMLRSQWLRTMKHRYRGAGLPEGELERLYDEHEKMGGTHAEIAKRIARSGALEDLRRKVGFSGARASQEDRDAAVAANAKQYHEARKMAGPQGRAMLANTMLGAQNPFDLARAAAAAHALDPAAGWGNLGMGIGAEAANAQAVAGMGGQRQGPVAKMDADRAIVREKPLGQRAQGYRDMYRGLNAGQPMNPQQESLFLVTEGTGDASAAAGAIIGGTGGDEEMAFLREYTNAFIAGGESTNRDSFEKWSIRLGIPVTQESMQLWQSLTNTNVRYFHEYFGFKPVPSARKPAPGKGKPPAKPKRGVSPRAAPPRRPFKDD